MQLSWTQVVLVFVLLGSVIGAHIWAPTSVQIVISLVSTLIGAVFVNVQKTPDGKNGEAAPSLSIVNTGQFPAAKDPSKKE